MIVITAMTGHVKYDTERTVINLYYPAWEFWGGGATCGPPQLNARMNWFQISSVALALSGWLIDCVDGVTELSKVLILNVPLSIWIKRDGRAAGGTLKAGFRRRCVSIFICAAKQRSGDPAIWRTLWCWDAVSPPNQSFIEPLMSFRKKCHALAAVLICIFSH